MLRAALVLALLSVLTLGCRDEPGNQPASSGSGAAGGDGGMGGAGAAGGAGGMGAGGTGGGDGPLTLIGTIVTPDEAFEGQVRIVGDVIDCVQPGDGCAQDGDNVIDTEGVIAPGLIDTHNHILFDIFDETDWSPALQACSINTDCDDWGSCNNGNCACVDSVCKYNNHDQWPKEDAYALMLDYKQCLDDAGQGKPPWCPQTYDGDGKLKCEMVKWGEMKGLVAGTTSIVGLPGVSSKCFGSVARSIDVSQNDLDDDKVQTAAVFPSASSANGACANFTDGDTDAYLIHVAEGFDQNALDEWTDLSTITTPDGCLISEQTAITHGSALTSAEYDLMAAAGMKLIWSPASNMALYGRTTDIPTALDAGLTISLAPDWSMGGSQNLLDELRFADNVNATLWNDPRLSPESLVRMVTAEAAQVLALDLPGGIGRLAEGYKADLVVFDALENDPFMTILSASPSEVALVIVGGVPLYGEPGYIDLHPDSATCDVLDICGENKFLCVAEDSLDTDDKLDQRFDEIELALQNGLIDLDNIPELPPSACDNSCDADEACYERTVISTVNVSNCGGSCPPGEECFQQFMSGNNQFACLTPNTCYPVKNKSMAPLTPLVRCL